MRNILYWIPAFQWLKRYDSKTFASDMVAAIIVAIMLIPQSLAYALLAGLPAEVGLYASILPLVLYALFGTSSTLSVGPVAITSLMTAAALGNVASQGHEDYIAAAITLASMSGIILLAFGVFKLGFLANFLSHTVVSAFITASAIIIALSQTKHILGIEAQGHTLIALAVSLFGSIGFTNLITLGIGLFAICLLLLIRYRGVRILQFIGVTKPNAQLISKAAPVLAIGITILATALFSLDDSNVAIVGEIPGGLPTFVVPDFSMDLVRLLIMPAVLISIIGYVESVSVGRTLAAKRHERVDSNQELIGLGIANVGSAVSGGLPVTGGFSRSIVNFDAGAVTQAASIYTAIFIAIVSVFLTPVLYYLPQATLAATIIVAVTTLIDFSVIKKTWGISKGDTAAVLTTLFITLIFGVEAGVSSGVIISICLHLYRTSKPHIAEVGLVEGTEHFRNILRFEVRTLKNLLTLRVDESLFFANVSYLEDKIYSAIHNKDDIQHVVLMCTAVNEIDYSALKMLENVNVRLREQGITFHLSEVKGPVWDMLNKTNFLDALSGKVYLNQYQAFLDIEMKITS